MVTRADPVLNEPAPGAQPDQRAVYRMYVHLRDVAADSFDGGLAGKLIASAGFGLNCAELALASTIASGCFLGVENDQHLLKAAFRNGSCDFMVNTLDEALRALKNEIRKGQPLAVGLLGQPSEVFAETIERGVQPDIVAASMESNHPLVNESFKRFIASGSIPFQVDDAKTADPNLVEIFWTATKPHDLHRLDEKAMNWLPSNDDVRRRWIEQAGSRFYRRIPLERILAVNSDEISSLIDDFGQAGPWNGGVTVRWASPDGSQFVKSL